MVQLTLGPVPDPINPSDPVNKAYVDSGSGGTTVRQWLYSDPVSSTSSGSAASYALWCITGKKAATISATSAIDLTTLLAAGGRTGIPFKLLTVMLHVFNKGGSQISAKTLLNYYRVYNFNASTVRINQSSTWRPSLGSDRGFEVVNPWADLPADIVRNEVLMIGTQRNYNTSAVFSCACLVEFLVDPLG